MTDTEKKLVKEGVVSIFNNFNILEHTACLGGLRDDILRLINSMPQEPVNENLEQAIDTYLATYFGGEKEKQDWPFLKKMAIHFAEWQKEQMMKGAIDGQLENRDDYLCIKCLSMSCRPQDDGKLVKLIIIKED